MANSLGPAAPEFWFPVDISQLPANGREYAFSADDAACKRVASRLNLLELPKLTAKVTITPKPGRLIHVQGHMDAEVVQECVVTLAPVSAAISEDFDLMFSQAAESKFSRELDLSPDEEPPELLTGDELDLGEVLVEQLALTLEPYPRAPGAVFEAPRTGDEEGPGATVSAFAALAKLKKINKDK